MQKRDLVVRLEDVRKHIEVIENIVAKASNYNELSSDLVLRLALERAFEIIGEALYQIEKIAPLPSITDIDKIISLRHLLVHDYFKVKHELLWFFATEKIPQLKTEVVEWIDKENLKLFGTTNPGID